MTSKSIRNVGQMGPSSALHKVRIVCISDTHELHRELSLPDGDLLIHAGDITFFNSICD